MESLEGYTNVIEVSREQFLAGPRKRTEKNLNQRSVESILYLSKSVEKNAKITLLPTAAAERVPYLDDVLEQFVEMGIVWSIIQQLGIKNRGDEATEIKIYCNKLTTLGYGAPDIADCISKYTETIDPVLAEIAWTAIDVINARRQIIDIEVFASERGKA